MRKFTDWIYAALIAIMGAGLTEFFHRQTIRYHGKYISDTIVYAQNLGDVKECRMIAWIFGRLNELDGSYYAIAVFMSLVVAATVVAGYFFISFFLARENCETDRWKIQLASFCMLFSGPIYIPGLHPHFYSYTWPKYAWHSPTEMAMVLFAIIALQVFVKTYDSYFEEIPLKRWLGLAVLLFLSAWAKPNFIFAFAPVLAVLLIADLIRRREYKFIHRLRRVILLGSSILPAGIFILVLNHIEFSGSEEGEGIEIRVGYFLRNMEHPEIAIFFSLAFALLVFIVNFRKIRDVAYQAAAGVFLAGTAEYLILVEGGKRINHGNFGWGRQVGEYLLFAFAIVMYMKNLHDKEFMADRPALRRIYLCAGGLLLAAHVISQLYYVLCLLRGELYRM